MKLEITTQQAIELEMVLQSVKDFGILIAGINTESYSPAIAQLHEQVKERLDAQVKHQKFMQEIAHLSFSEKMKVMCDHYIKGE